MTVRENLASASGIALAMMMVAMSNLRGAVTAYAAQPEMVDLVVSGIAPSATEPPKVVVLVRNQGDITVKRAFDVELWLNEQLLGRQRVTDELESGARLHLIFMRPEEVAEGFHSLTATVDTGSEIAEAREDNNETGLTIYSKGNAAAVKEQPTITEGRRGQ